MRLFETPSDICLWFPPLVEAVFKKHDQVFDAARFNFSVLFQSKLCLDQPVALMLGLELFDRILSKKQAFYKIRVKSTHHSEEDCEAYYEKTILLSHEKILLFSIELAMKSVIDKYSLVVEGVLQGETKPLERAEGYLALWNIPDLSLIPDINRTIALMKSTVLVLSNDDIALMFSHLFYLKTNMFGHQEEGEVLDTLVNALLDVTGRSGLFEKLLREFQAEGKVGVLSANDTFVICLCYCMASAGYFTDGRIPLKSYSQQIDNLVLGFYAEKARTFPVNLRDFEPVEGFRCMREYEDSSEKFPLFNFIDPAILEKYYRSPALSGQLPLLLGYLKDLGVLGLYQYFHRTIQMQQLIPHINMFIDLNGQLSAREIASLITQLTNQYLTENIITTEQIIKNPLSRDFPHYRELLISAIEHLYFSCLQDANLFEDTARKTEFRQRLDGLTNMELLTYLSVAETLFQSHSGSEHEILVLVLNNLQFIKVFDLLAKTFDHHALLGKLTARDFSYVPFVMAQLPPEKHKEILSNHKQFIQFTRGMANEMVYQLLATKRCGIDDAELIHVSADFGLDLNNIEERLEQPSEVSTSVACASVTLFSTSAKKSSSLSYAEMLQSPPSFPLLDELSPSP